MKATKFVLLVLGIAMATAVFLPFIELGGRSWSMWELAKLASELDEEAMVPIFTILAASLTMAALAAAGVARKQFGRISASICGVLPFAILYFTAKFGGAAGAAMRGGLISEGLLGSKILLFGGLIALLVSVAGLIKPECAEAASRLSA